MSTQSDKLSAQLRELSNEIERNIADSLKHVRAIADMVERMDEAVPDQRWLAYPLDDAAPVTGEFGELYSINGMTWQHEGIDFGIPNNTPVRACGAGTVVSNGVRGGYGQCVKIEHSRNGEKWWTWYAHLNAAACVIGQTILTGQLVGVSGQSGNVTGPHLHLTVQRASSDYRPAGCTSALRGVVNPREWLTWKDKPPG